MPRPCTCPEHRYGKALEHVRRLFARGDHVKAMHEAIGFLQGELFKDREHRPDAAPAVHAQFAAMVMNLARLAHAEQPQPGPLSAIFEAALAPQEDSSHVSA
jgi:hypothetical protein